MLKKGFYSLAQIEVLDRTIQELPPPPALEAGSDDEDKERPPPPPSSLLLFFSSSFLSSSEDDTEWEMSEWEIIKSEDVDLVEV